MAKVPVQKIRIAGLRKHYKVLIQELHRRGLMDIDANPEFEKHSTEASELGYFDAFDLARIDFAIRFLAPHAPVKGKLEKMLTADKVILSEKEALAQFGKFSPHADGIISECEEIHEFFVRTKNEIARIKNEVKSLIPFQGLNFVVDAEMNTGDTMSQLTRISTAKKTVFIEQLAHLSSLLDIRVFYEDKQNAFFRLTWHRSLKQSVEAVMQQFGAREVSLANDFGSEFSGLLPREITKKLNKKQEDLDEEWKKKEVRLKQIGKHYDDLRIAHDFHSWRKDKNDAQQRVLKTSHLFAFEGWVPADKFEAMQYWITQVFVGDVTVEKITAGEGEKVPSLIQNKPVISSFNSITEMFGAPGKEDIDPTPAITPFFIIFFGVCLSDSGYGLILALAAAFFMVFGKFSKDTQKMILMLLLCGLSAVVGGVLLGGHFGMTVEEAPAFLTTVNETGKVVFRGQILDPLSGTGTMTFLAFTFAIGYFQVLVGLFMRILKGISNKDWGLALCDGLGWLYTLVMLALWAGAEKIGLDKTVMQWFLLGGVAFLVLTLGRSKKNIFAKLVFGVLGLYGAMDFVSNILSYSRLMALGLATGIIGAAMNMTAHVLGDMLPGVLGIIVMIAFMLFGHAINFGLSGLGAYVHSLRLQFIEFFGIFYAGGGRLFRPFARAKKYLLFRS
jgi:V/A-type H+-transporting ATPase subunit I